MHRPDCPRNVIDAVHLPAPGSQRRLALLASTDQTIDIDGREGDTLIMQAMDAARLVTFRRGGATLGSVVVSGGRVLRVRAPSDFDELLVEAADGTGVLLVWREASIDDPPDR